MAKFDELKDTVMDAIGVAAVKTRDIAGNVADKAKNVSRIAKLNFEISGERDTIKKAYIEIGKLYYETYRDNPDGFFVQLCDEIDMANESIKAKEDEIAKLKEEAEKARTVEDPDCVIEFEEIVAEAEAAVEDVAAEVEDAAAEVVEAAETAADAAVEAAEDAVEE